MKTSMLARIYVCAFTLLSLLFSCKKDDGQDATPDPDPGKIEVLTANAGNDQTVQVRTTVALDGSGSKSSLNNPFTFKWTFTKTPGGSKVAFIDDKVEKPTFVPDLIGEYEIELTISNASGKHQDRVAITSEAAQPLAIEEDIVVKTILVDRNTSPITPDYIVKKDISVTAELTIKPGVIIAFDRNTRLDIDDQGGAIIAKGEAEKKIVFQGLENIKGFWKGLVIYSNSGVNILEHVEVLHAGSYETLSAIKAGLTLFGGSKARISIKNSLFSESSGYGIHVASGSILHEFSKNTLSKNTEAGILVDAPNVSKLDEASVFTSENGRNAIEITSSALENEAFQEVMWTGFKDNTPYRILKDLTVKTGWKIKAGVTVELGDNALVLIEAQGYISAKGTSERKIVFTGTNKSTGFWKGIISYSTSILNEMEFAEISYGGSTEIVSGKKANIAVYGASSRLSLKNCTISNSKGYGIFVGYGSAINQEAETSNTFLDNEEGRIFRQ